MVFTFYKSLQADLDKRGHWEGDVWDFLPNGNAYLKHLNIQAVTDPEGEVSYYFAVFSELSTLHRNEAELERLIHYDPLTDLPNRILFRNRLGHEFNISSRHTDLQPDYPNIADLTSVATSYSNLLFLLSMFHNPYQEKPLPLQNLLIYIYCMQQLH